MKGNSVVFLSKDRQCCQLNRNNIGSDYCNRNYSNVIFDIDGSGGTIDAEGVATDTIEYDNGTFGDGGLIFVDAEFILPATTNALEEGNHMSELQYCFKLTH